MLVQSQLVFLLDELLNQTARLRKGGTQAVYFCPECKHYKRKLEINLETGQWHCWTCNIKGSFLGSFLTKIKAPQSYRHKISQLTGDLRIAMRNKQKVSDSEICLPEEFIPLSSSNKTLEYKNAMVYLMKRGFIAEDIIRHNIGYCEEGDYAYHIIIPSYDMECKLNFFIGRRYYDVDGAIPYKKPNYPMNIVGFESFINYNEPLNLCEGVFDAIAIRNNASPLFGKYPSKKLRERMIVNGVKRVNIILDNDAYKDAVKNYEMIKKDVPGVEISVIKLNDKDPSLLGFDKTHKIIRDAQPFDEEDLFKFNLNL